MNDSFITISKDTDFVTCLATMLKIFLKKKKNLSKDSDSSYFTTTLAIRL